MLGCPAEGPHDMEHRCRECGSERISPPAAEDGGPPAANMQCPACGSVIPAASTRCDVCGWTAPGK